MVACVHITCNHVCTSRKGIRYGYVIHNNKDTDLMVCSILDRCETLGQYCYHIITQYLQQNICFHEPERYSYEANVIDMFKLVFILTFFFFFFN